MSKKKIISLVTILLLITFIIFYDNNYTEAKITVSGSGATPTQVVSSSGTKSTPTPKPVSSSGIMGTPTPEIVSGSGTRPTTAHRPASGSGTKPTSAARTWGQTQDVLRDLGDAAYTRVLGSEDESAALQGTALKDKTNGDTSEAAQYAEIVAGNGNGEKTDKESPDGHATFDYDGTSTGEDVETMSMLQIPLDVGTVSQDDLNRASEIVRSGENSGKTVAQIQADLRRAGLSDFTYVREEVTYSGGSVRTDNEMNPAYYVSLGVSYEGGNYVSNIEQVITKIPEGPTPTPTPRISVVENYPTNAPRYPTPTSYVQNGQLRINYYIKVSNTIYSRFDFSPYNTTNVKNVSLNVVNNVQADNINGYTIVGYSLGTNPPRTQTIRTGNEVQITLTRNQREETINFIYEKNAQVQDSGKVYINYFSKNGEILKSQIIETVDFMSEQTRNSEIIPGYKYIGYKVYNKKVDSFDDLSNLAYITSVTFTLTANRPVFTISFIYEEIQITPTSAVKPKVSVTPTMRVTPKVSATPTIRVTPKVSATPTIRVSIKASATPTIRVTPKVSATPTIRVTPKVSATPTIRVTPKVSATPTIRVTPKVSATPTIRVTPKVSATPTIRVSVKASATPTVRVTPRVYATPTTPVYTIIPSVPATPVDGRQIVVRKTAEWVDQEKTKARVRIEVETKIIGTDYVLILDKSLSGKGQYAQAAEIAAREFLDDTVQLSNRVAIVEFSEDANAYKANCSVTPLYVENNPDGSVPTFSTRTVNNSDEYFLTDKSTLGRIVNTFAGKGTGGLNYTNLDAPLYAARELIQKRSNKDRNVVVVFLSDGAPDPLKNFSLNGTTVDTDSSRNSNSRGMKLSTNSNKNIMSYAKDLRNLGDIFIMITGIDTTVTYETYNYSKFINDLWKKITDNSDHVIDARFVQSYGTTNGYSGSSGSSSTLDGNIAGLVEYVHYLSRSGISGIGGSQQTYSDNLICTVTDVINYDEFYYDASIANIRSNVNQDKVRYDSSSKKVIWPISGIKYGEKINGEWPFLEFTLRLKNVYLKGWVNTNHIDDIEDRPTKKFDPTTDVYCVTSADDDSFDDVTTPSPWLDREGNEVNGMIRVNYLVRTDGQYSKIPGINSIHREENLGKLVSIPNMDISGYKYVEYYLCNDIVDGTKEDIEGAFDNGNEAIVSVKLTEDRPSQTINFVYEKLPTKGMVHVAYFVINERQQIKEIERLREHRELLFNNKTDIIAVEDSDLNLFDYDHYLIIDGEDYDSSKGLRPEDQSKDDRRAKNVMVDAEHPVVTIKFFFYAKQGAIRVNYWYKDNLDRYSRIPIMPYAKPFDKTAILGLEEIIKIDYIDGYTFLRAIISDGISDSYTYNPNEVLATIVDSKTTIMVDAEHRERSLDLVFCKAEDATPKLEAKLTTDFSTKTEVVSSTPNGVGEIFADDANNKYDQNGKNVHYDVSLGIPTSEKVGFRVSLSEYIFDGQYSKVGMNGSIELSVPYYIYDVKDDKEVLVGSGTWKLTGADGQLKGIDSIYDLSSLNILGLTNATVKAENGAREIKHLFNFSTTGRGVISTPVDVASIKNEIETEFKPQLEQILNKSVQTKFYLNKDIETDKKEIEAYISSIMLNPGLNVKTKIEDYICKLIRKYESTVGSIKITSDDSLGAALTDAGNVRAEYTSATDASTTIPRSYPNGVYLGANNGVATYGADRTFVFNVNNVIVRTPVVNKTNITPEKFVNQKINRKDITYLQLDKSFVIDIESNGNHTEITSSNGYGKRKYNEGQGQNGNSWAKAYQVSMGFDTYKIDGNNSVFVPGGTWTDFTNGSTKFMVPVWVDEGEYRIETRVVAENLLGNITEYNTGIGANTGINQYAAADSVDVEVIGLLYDLHILENTGMAFEEADDIGATEVGEGEDPFGVPEESTVEKDNSDYIPSVGSSFAFDFKSKGRKSETIEVKVAENGFYFATKTDGTVSNAKTVDLWYKKDGQGNYIKLTKDDVDSTIVVTPDAEYMHIEKSEMDNSNRVYPAEGLRAIDYSIPINIGNAMKINLPHDLRLVYDNIREYENALYMNSRTTIYENAISTLGNNSNPRDDNESGSDRVIGSVGHWYVSYKLPSTTVAVERGKDPNENSSAILKNGYILVDFGIMSKAPSGNSDANGYLLYSGPQMRLDAGIHTIDVDYGDSEGGTDAGEGDLWDIFDLIVYDHPNSAIQYTIGNGQKVNIPNDVNEETNMRPSDTNVLLAAYDASSSDRPNSSQKPAPRPTATKAPTPTPEPVQAGTITTDIMDASGRVIGTSENGNTITNMNVKWNDVIQIGNIRNQDSRIKKVRIMVGRVSVEREVSQFPVKIAVEPNNGANGFIVRLLYLDANNQVIRDESGNEIVDEIINIVI